MGKSCNKAATLLQDLPTRVRWWQQFSLQELNHDDLVPHFNQTSILDLNSIISYGVDVGTMDGIPFCADVHRPQKTTH